MYRKLIQRPVSVLLVAVGVVCFGVAAFRELPVSTLPEVEYPIITVQAELPGASASTVATTLAAPLERSLINVPGLVGMTSSSASGRVDLTLQFGLGRSMMAISGDVQTALANASRDLPRDMPSPPRFRTEGPGNSALIFLAFSSDVLAPEDVSAYVQDVASPMLRGLPGVGQLVYFGERKRAVTIAVDPRRLAARGLTLEDVRLALDGLTANGPKGAFEGPHRRSVIATNDQLTDAAAFGDAIIASPAGRPVRLRDVAEVTDGAEDPHSFGLLDGKPAVVVGVRRVTGANTIATVDAIRAATRKLSETLPPTIRLQAAADRSASVRASVADVELTLVLTIVLVSLTVLAFLRTWQASAIAAVVIPMSILVTFLVMYGLGYSINNITLIALTISVGLVVDDAVVVIENTMKRIEEGQSVSAATLDSIGEVGFTLLSITVTLVAAFIPLLFMGGIAGQIFREFGVTLAVAVAASGVVSVTLTPVLCRLLLRRAKRAHVPDGGRVIAFYRRTLEWSLRRWRTTLLVFGAVLAATAYLYSSSPKGFFPEQDTRQVNGGLLAPPDASPEMMARLARLAVQVIGEDPDVSHVIGTASGTTVFFLIDLRPIGSPHGSSRDFIRRMRASLQAHPELKMFLQPRQELVFGSVMGRSQYEYTITAASSDELAHWVPKFVDGLGKVPGVVQVGVDGLDSVREVSFEIDRERAAELGISIDAIDQTLYDAFGSRKIQQVQTDTNQHAVILQMQPDLAAREDALSLVYMRSQSGAIVPLDTLVEARVGETPMVINHKGQLAAATITFDLAPGTSLSETMTRIAAMERGLARTPTVRTSFDGGANEFQKTMAEQPMLLLIAVIVVWIVLGMLYESFIHPLVILSTLPPAGIGALLLIRATDGQLDIMGFVGIILIIGIVKKNAIMVVDCALDLERRHPDMTARQAVVEASLRRFRPIIMTTLAAIAGAIPLALDHGMGAELRRAIGLAVLGGIAVSQLLTLYTTPVIYIAMTRASNAARELFRGKRSLASAPVTVEVNP